MIALVDTVLAVGNWIMYGVVYNVRIFSITWSIFKDIKHRAMWEYVLKFCWEREDPRKNLGPAGI